MHGKVFSSLSAYAKGLSRSDGCISSFAARGSFAVAHRKQHVDFSTHIEYYRYVHKIACVKCFAGLGVESRMQIYRYLKDHNSASVTELVGIVGLTQPTVSYHLKEMKDLGLLTSVKHGKEVMYEINPICSLYKKECVLSKVDLNFD